jgi:hypothetical protein
VSYSYSVDGGETYHGSFDTRADALRHGLAVSTAYWSDTSTVWTAVRLPVDVGALVSDWSRVVVGALAEGAADEYYREYVDEWPRATPSEERALDQAIRAAVVAWVEAHCPPPFFRIDPGTAEAHAIERGGPDADD